MLSGDGDRRSGGGRGGERGDREGGYRRRDGGGGKDTQTGEFQPQLYAPPSSLLFFPGGSWAWRKS